MPSCLELNCCRFAARNFIFQPLLFIFQNLMSYLKILRIKVKKIRYRELLNIVWKCNFFQGNWCLKELSIMKIYMHYLMHYFICWKHYVNIFKSLYTNKLSWVGTYSTQIHRHTDTHTHKFLQTHYALNFKVLSLSHFACVNFCFKKTHSSS